MRDIKFRFWRDGKMQQAHQLNAYVNTDNNFAGDGEVLMQFTGLRDRNGKEIYEGDIVEALNNIGFDHGDHKGEAFEVFWFKENGAWYIQRKYRDEENMLPLVFCNEMVANCDLEVIGNIYENPELLNNQ